MTDKPLPAQPAALDRLLIERARRPGLAPLWQVLARRMEQQEAPVVRVSLRRLDEQARIAIADLLGMERLPGTSLVLAVNSITAALRLSGDTELRQLVEQVVGPLRNRAAERRTFGTQRNALWTWLSEREPAPELAPWISRLRAAGVPNGDVAAHRVRLERAANVLDALPANDVPLSVLATRLLGDPHALDSRRRLCAIVLDALATKRGTRYGGSSEQARALWASVGVLADRLSVAVLTLNLRTGSDTPLARVLEVTGQEREPTSLTLSQLQRWPIASMRQSVVNVFENPAMLARAAAASAPLPALVCTSGWPNAAAIELLRQLTNCGVQLHYHGDFDAGGIEIARHLRKRLGAEPWRMTSTDYERAAATSDAPLRGRVPDTPWDPQLARAMRQRGVVVYEEQLADELIRELSSTT